MATDNAVKHFFVLYVMAGSNMDTSTVWNEIDTTLANGPATGQMFSGTYFSPTMDLKSYTPTTTPSYSQAFSEQWHNYTLSWTPTTLTWSIDGVPYRVV